MSGFVVNVAGLGGLTAQLRRAQADLSKTAAHVSKADFIAFSGILQPVAETARNVGAQQIGSIDQGASLCGGNADAIAQAATYYGKTDQRQAVVFDAQQPAVATPASTQQPTPRQSYTDPMHPQGRLNEPPSYAEEMSWKPSVESDLGNVGSVIRWVIQQVFGVDFLQIIGEWLLSDWPEIRRIGDRFNNAAWACSDVATNLRAGITDAEHDWSGNAASEALSWLDDLAKALDSCHEQNEYLSENFTQLAEGFFDGFKVLSQLLTDWVNKLILAAASGTAAGLAEEVPVLDVFLDVNAAQKIWDAVNDGYEVYDKVNKIKDLIEGFHAAISVGSGAFRDMVATASPMPNAPWDTVPYPS